MARSALRLTHDQQRWIGEIRAFLSEHLTAEVRAEVAAYLTAGYGPALRRFRHAVGARRWNVGAWPEAIGGLGMTPIEQFLLAYEFDYAGIPKGLFTASGFAPVILEYGTAANRTDWIEPLRTGDVVLALGYSEPDAGTDLASLTTKAVRDGDEWVINGHKTWNTAAHRATHEWLAVRTDPTAPRHEGISVIIVPIDSPGISIVGLDTWGGVRTNDVYFDDVRVPARNLIGEPNRGWRYIAAALEIERALIGGGIGSVRRLLDDIGTAPRRVSGPTWHEYAALDARVEAATLMGLELAAAMTAGVSLAVRAPMLKVVTSELRTAVSAFGLRVLGADGLATAHDVDARLGGVVEEAFRLAPFLRFGGGTNEVLRDIIAQRSFGLPRSRMSVS